MGVHGLWELLAPVGRRVSVETLAGKKLAIDASIWMIQFMKAMRDERGEMVKNAHILGFFRRICKLLFLRSKPVFVFDGGTPALKRRTVIARRRQRENAQAKIRKTAEKLLLNHLKTRKLEELANEIKNKKQKGGSKGKQVISDDAGLNENSSLETGFERTKVVTDTYDHGMLDEMLAASLAAEEDEKFFDDASTSVGGTPYEEEDMMDDNEEMDIPEIQGKIDPAVLASLPPSVQLDLLVQMRERLMAENRQKYQKVKKAPTKFSELQIQSYLKTVAFRREIDEVQKSAAGRGVSGVPVSRIASEANREFIFSSSFTGDKRVLATSGVEKNGDAEHQTHETHLPSSDSLNCNLPTVPFHSVTGTDIDDSARDSDHPVETYLDERGRVRVSRVRGMGIHMTRDLQWNLNMMNELEQQRAENTNSRKDMTSSVASLGVTKDLDNSHLMGASSAEGGDGDNCGLQESSVRHRSAIEVSFLEDETDPKSRDDVDDLFANLVAGSSALGFSSENGHAQEENVLLRKCQNEAQHSDMREERQSSLIEGSHISDDNEVDWEDGVCDIPVNPSPCLNDNKASVSKGSLEEDADMQEAIRRSLEDYAMEKSACPSSAKISLSSPGEMISEEKIIGLPLQLPVLAKNGNDSPNMLLEDDLPRRVESMDGPELIHNMGGNVGQNIDGGSWNKLPAPATTPELDTDVNFIVVDEPFENDQASEVELLSQAMAGDGNGCLGTSDTDQDTPLEPIKVCTTKDVEFQDVSDQMGKKSSFIVPTEVSPVDSSHMPTKVVDGLPAVIDAEFRHSQTSASYNHSETMKCSASVQEGSFPKADPIDIAREQELYDLIDDEAEHYREMKKIQDNFRSQNVVDAEADLGEEMLLLRQEQVELRDEQQKLERNAESVSSEMFAECQELLQMFGLPYIIAPMEAEAQCAYLEIKGLVDGIVTDDSDAFLFGGRSVYKNIFDDRKYVETYLMKDIESELGLTREMLIRMALLLGSDYTEGVSGIGIVNAIEVVHAFPEEDGLQKFREWIESPDPSILDKVDAHSGKSSRKRCSKDGNNHGDGSISMVGGPDDQQWANNIPNLKQNFMEKHRNVSKNWHIPSSFPSESVVSAYASAQVDDSTEPFSWGKPDLFILRKLCWERFGWNNQKADELLQPVLKEYNRHETQLRLEAFYSFNERFAKIRSRRIQKAVKGITGKRSAELMTDIQKENSKLKKRRETASPEEDKAAVGNQREGPEKLASNYPKGKKVKTQLSQSEDGQPEILIRGEGRGIDKKQSRGRGTGRGRGKGRGRRIEGSSTEESKTSCSGADDDNNEKVEQLQMKTKEPSELRRSARSKNNVSYMEEDAEADGISGLPNHNTENSIDDEVMEQEPFSDNQSAKPCNEGGASPGDYLFSGGGFCVDEADQSNVPVEGFPSPAKASDGLSVDGNFDLDASEINNNLDKKRFLACDGLTKTKGSQQEDILQQCREDSGRISRVQTINESDQVTEGELNMGLKAMPSLRRKRKKP